MRRREVTMTTSMAFTARSFLLRLALAAAIVVCFALLSRAGGPKCVAGSTYFDPTTTGQPLVWPQGLITYYTDQGDLSPLLTNEAANAFVADAFRQWTSVPTAALAATSGGQLAEDVDSSNVTTNTDGTLSIPVDIQSSSTSTPIGIIYDYDGSVTDALIGAGAGDPSQCFFNAAFGGNDNYGTFATYQHALIVINGQCAQLSSQLVEVEYRLVRVIGAVLGVGGSQVNLNVITGTPPPTADDFAGFPVMHGADSLSCVPITRCYANPYQLAMDDVAAISRLYPVTAQNQSDFTGKQLFAASTARIHGSVWFTDSAGGSTQPMQGVNVVARWIDPKTGQPSRRFAAAAVSGFLFTGNAGNSITGYNDALGDPFSDWGSSSQALEGSFDLAGLQLPSGGSAQYQLSVEGLDPQWSVGVGPYAPGPVAPSGVAQPVLVTVTAGKDVQQDILMHSSAQPVSQTPSGTWTAPAALPPAGDWVGSLNSYGNVSYFLLRAQANRTLSVAVTALDEAGVANLDKAQPVIGMWDASDPEGTDAGAFTPSPFNQPALGLTRLDAQISASTNFLIGISDVRGDGRPDYHYHAYVLYADSVFPPRLGVNGGAITIKGTGFVPGLIATVGGSAATPLAVSSGQIVLSAPAYADGPQSIAITDPATGSSTTMADALTFGAAADDNIILVRGLNPSTPVGVQATNPVIVQVLAADGVTPVNGATVAWSANKGLQLSACGGASACSVTSDQSGEAITWLTPTATGAATITATLAPGAYNSSKSVSATLSATESAADIGVLTPYLWISQGATVSIPISARVLNNGAPQNNVRVNFTVVSGSGNLSAASALTNSTGYATVSLSLTQFTVLVQVNACVAPNNAPCQSFYGTPVPAALQKLQPVAGAGQISTGQSFQPVVVRVTDSSSPPNAVRAAPVGFQTTVMRPGGSSTSGGGGDLDSADSAMVVILSATQSSAASDGNGLANIVPSSGGFSGPLIVDVAATAGASGLLDNPLEVLLPSGSGTKETIQSPLVGRLPLRRRVEVRGKEVEDP